MAIIKAVLAFLGISPVSALAVLLLGVGYIGATWTAYYNGEAACVARHEDAARALQRKLDDQVEVWRREVAAAAEADTKLNAATDGAANALDNLDASNANCAGPRSMQRLDSIR